MRFSVIIPLYNKAPYVEKALRSVVDQTYLDYEIIVIDDGSQDGSAEIAERVLAGASVPHQVICQANAGVSTARNNGAAIAKGEYVSFLDADDWWSPAFLEKMDRLIRNYPEAGIYGTNYFYVKNGRRRVCVKSAETGYIDYCTVYASGLAMPLTSISVAISLDVFREFSGFKPMLKLGEDFDLWIRIALKYKVAFLNEPLAYYNQDPNPAWRGTGRLQKPENHMLWNLGYLEDKEKTLPEYKRLIDSLRTYNLLPYYLSGEYREAARQELRKVDWTSQPEKYRKLYSQPVLFAILQYRVRKAGSFIKQWIIRHQ